MEHIMDGGVIVSIVSFAFYLSGRLEKMEGKIKTGQDLLRFDVEKRIGKVDSKVSNLCRRVNDIEEKIK